ncbi:MAG: enoyl-CoA hydratase-related protein [Actinomycetota bacterium]|nr:enoyl-CoA hydratase-related protein [Actinomycetota bacterium]
MSERREHLLTDRDGPVAILTLHRPDRLNAISGPMLAGLSAALVEADRDPEVRCIVLTGAGRAFCAGLDLRDQAAGPGLDQEDPDARSRRGELDLRDAPPTVLHNLDTPTVCALNGGAAGYGMDLALGCDIRVAAESAKLAPAFVKRGVLPESGGTWLLPRLVGYAKAAEIAFTGETLLAKECLELGLVNSVVPDASLMNEALSLARRIAGNAPLAVRATKRMFRMAEREGFDDHVHHVYLQLLPLFASQDFREGMAAFLERRDPHFTGR